MMSIRDQVNKDSLLASGVNNWSLDSLWYEGQVWQTPPNQKPASLPLTVLPNDSQLNVHKSSAKVEQPPQMFVRLPHRKKVSSSNSESQQIPLTSFFKTTRVRRCPGSKWEKSSRDNSDFLKMSQSGKSSFSSALRRTSSEDFRHQRSRTRRDNARVPYKDYQKLKMEYSMAVETIKRNMWLTTETHGMQKNAIHFLHQEALAADHYGSQLVNADARENPTDTEMYSCSATSFQNHAVNTLSKVICSEALRPVVFHVNIESPPDGMQSIIERLATSKNRCESCGKKLQGGGREESCQGGR